MPICDLVLEGGGVRGIALVGALEVLEEHGYRVSRVAGSSAGAVVGALVAAGMPAAEVRRHMRDVDYGRFTDLPRWVRWLGPLQGLGKGVLLAREAGIYQGEYFRTWMSSLLAQRGVRTFADLAMEDPGSSLPAERRYRLVVTASDVTASRLRRLPWDYPTLGYEAQSRVVADAVRASMSIPFFFQPVRLPDPSGGVPTTLVDGGVLSNFPVTIFDRTDGRPPRWPTFGIKLSARPGAVAPPREDVRGAFATSRAILSTLLSAHDAQHIDDPSVVARTIFIDTAGVASTDFTLSRETAEKLYVAGRQAATRFLATWDWEAYRREYGPQPLLPEQIAGSPATSATRQVRSGPEQSAATDPMTAGDGRLPFRGRSEPAEGPRNGR